MSKLDGISTSLASNENRIKTNGQVFTPDSIVNDMLDDTDRKLAEYFGVNSVNEISDEDYINYVVFEPTAGNGNFLIRELDRKLERVQNYFGIGMDIALLKAVASIHSVELTAENVVSAKLRMMEVIENGSTPVFELEYKEVKPFRTKGFEISQELKKCIQFILDRNIQCGDVLKSDHLLTWKDESIDSIWNLDKNKLNFADALFRTDERDDELKLTQYDFESSKVAIRERAYSNMHDTVERYSGETGYVDYNKLYTLPSRLVYVEAVEDNEELDF